MTRQPTNGDFAVLRETIAAIDDALEVHSFLEAAFDRLEAGGTLSEVEWEEYRRATALNRRACESIKIFESWSADVAT